MPVLQPNEYDISYFDGNKSTYTHNAGYSNYSRMQYNCISTRFVPTLEDSTGTVFGDLTKGFNLRNNIIGKKVLVIGCAYGFEVKGFRDLGIDAYGIDVSSYAISQADPSITPYLEVADVRVKLADYRRNEFDWIFSRGLLECMSDLDLTLLIPEMNKVSRNQVHFINPGIRADFYNQKTLLQYADLPFDVGTILIPNDNLDEYVTVIN